MRARVRMLLGSGHAGPDPSNTTNSALLADELAQEDDPLQEERHSYSFLLESILAFLGCPGGVTQFGTR